MRLVLRAVLSGQAEMNSGADEPGSRLHLPAMNSPTLRTTRVARAGYLLALASTLLGATCNAQPVTVHVTRAQILEVPTTGFSPPPYSIASGAFEGNWVETTLPHAPRPQILTREAKSSADQVATVITWYRIQVPGLEKAPTANYLYIPRWKTDGTITVYVDSRLVYQSHANLLWNGSNNPLWISLDETADARAPREILVRIQHLQGTGGALSSIWVGPHDALAWRYRTVLAADAVRRRTKEIALRKLFGTRRADIGKLVARDIGAIILLAAVIALPVSALAIARYLAPFSEQTPLAFWSLGIALAFAVVTAALAAARQAWTAMILKPAVALRS